MEVADLTNFLGITNTKESESKVSMPTKVFVREEAGPRKIVYAWEAPTRGAFSIDKYLSKNVVITLIVIGLVLLAMQEFLLIGLIASIIFLAYILSATPTSTAIYELTNHGISFAGQFYYWDELRHFFFKKSEISHIACVDTVDPLPGRLYLNLDRADTTKVDSILQEFLPFLEEEPTTFVDDAFEYVVDRIKL